MTNEGTPENAGRNQGRFRKGQSGNPYGKPPGTRHRATRLAEAVLEGEADALMRKAIDLAKEGDVTALRFCLERLIPRRTEARIEFEMPAISRPKDAIAALSKISEGLGRGELTANQVGSLVALVEATLKAIEVFTLDERIAILEERTSAKQD